ncbi:MAG: Lrp/AsnC family transcriptional regulator [Candidatus Omnitrophica bacterium]|nr:Lrp/AsnC family transcriptional regulator [Candidatus Omnitrophota bacterium]
MFGRTEKRFLNLVQEGLPLVLRPYKKIGEALKISEEKAIDYARDLQKRKVIRRTEIIFDLQKLGFVSTLCAMKVPLKDIKRVAGIINDYPSVSHNYERRGEYNIWFTLTATSGSRLSAQLKEIEKKTGIPALDLRTEKMGKVKAVFHLK